MSQNCYNTGERIPREKNFNNQDERLTNKHIQTLQFVQEVVNENKVLKKRVEELEISQLNCDELHSLAEESKEKIKVIQEQYLKRADEINAMMAEKHRGEMMKVVTEKLDQEQKYSEQIVQLRTEIGQLENTNTELMGRVGELAKTQQQVEVLTADIEELKRIIADLQMEVEALKAENENLSGEKHSQFSQIQNLQNLRTQNETLSQDLKMVTTKNIELNHRNSRLESELKDNSMSKDQIDLIDNLKNKLAKLHKEKSIGAEKEEYYQKQVGDFQYEIEKLKEKVQSAEVTKDRVLEEYYKVQSELQYLRRHYSNNAENKNFKDFVKLKRENVTLKEENEDMRRNKPLGSSVSSGSLPMLRFEPAPPQPPVMKVNQDKKNKLNKKWSITSK